VPRDSPRLVHAHLPMNHVSRNSKVILATSGSQTGHPVENPEILQPADLRRHVSPPTSEGLQIAAGAIARNHAMSRDAFGQCTPHIGGRRCQSGGCRLAGVAGADPLFFSARVGP